VKILYTAFECHPEKGGEANYGWNWPLQMAKLGFDVSCITHTESKEAIEKHKQTYEGLNLKFYYVDMPKWAEKLWSYTPGMYIYYIFWQYKAYLLAKKLAEKQQFDIIHHVSWSSLQLSTFIWKLKSNFIFGPLGGGQYPNPNFSKYFVDGWANELKRKKVSDLMIRFNPNVKSAIQNAKLVLATNEETLDLVNSLGAKKADFFFDCGLPDDFYPEKYPERTKSDVLRILWVGRLLPRKGILLILEALAAVPKKIPFKLTIVGDGEQGKNLPTWIEELGLKEKVDWKGMIPWNEVRRHYAENDLFMFCTLRDSAAGQFFEAQAYGLPVLTLDIHGGRLMVSDDCGIKVPSTTPEGSIKELVKAIEYIYANPEKLQEMGRNAYKKMLQHNWTNRAKKMSEIYKDILKQ